MKTVPLLNHHALILCTLAFVLNLIFFMFNYQKVNQYFDCSKHAFLAYNLAHNNALTWPHEKLAYDDELNKVVDLSSENYDVSNLHLKKDLPAFPIQDTIGYGVILGMLWKLTDSMSLIDIQILQIIIFSLLMLLIYQIGLMLFDSTAVAFYSGIALLCFFPIIFLNVQVLRDIWAYYGLVILLYTSLRFLHAQTSLWHLAIGGILFALCQFVRPAVFLAVLTFSVVFIGYALFDNTKRVRLFKLLITFWLTNLFFFWLPFFVHNKSNYNRFFVGPAGQDLLESLGEFENPWGFKLSDQWVDEHVSKKYNEVYGTQEFDDKAKEEFWLAFYEQPSFYFKSFFKRIPGIIVPSLPWTYYKQSPYQGLNIFSQKLKHALSSPALFFDFLARHIYIRLFLLLGYLGMVLALFRRRYFAVALLSAVIVAGLGKLPSHIEYRYLIPYYWAFVFFVGYLVYELQRKIWR